MANVEYYSGQSGANQKYLDTGVTQAPEKVTDGPARTVTRVRNVLFDDDFSVGTTLPWVVTTTGITLARSTTAGEWSSGGAAMKVTTSTVASQTSNVGRATARRASGSSIVKFGGLYSIVDENIASLEFRVGYRDGTRFVRGVLRHTYSTNLWQFDIGGAGAESLSTLQTRDPSESTTISRWHYFEIAIDLVTSRYHSIVLDEEEFKDNNDVQTTLLRSTVDSTLPGLLEFTIQTVNLGGTPSAGVINFDQLFGVVL